MNSIIVNNVSLKQKMFALKNISFEVEQGTVVGVIGRNGAGKTTLLKCLLNLYRDIMGSIFLLEQNVLTQDAAIKAQLGVVFDEWHLPLSLKPTDLNKTYKLLFPTWDDAYYFQLLDELQLPHDKKIETYSRGMRMLLQLVLALSHHPKMLLLDEPTSGLDPVMRQHVLQLLSRYMEDDTNTIFFSSHITNDLEVLADTVLCLHNGAMLFHENKDTLLYEYVIISSNTPIDEAVAERETALYTEYLVPRSHLADTMQHRAVTLDDLLAFFTEPIV